MAVQIPAGVLVDAVRSRRLLASFAVTAISVSALAMAIWPVFPIVVGARILHAVASAILGPIIAALSLALVSHGALGERLGRNARFASIGSGVAAAAMGLTGYLISNQAIFTSLDSWPRRRCWRLPASTRSHPDVCPLLGVGRRVLTAPG